jgi:hypothetical protein
VRSPWREGHVMNDPCRIAAVTMLVMGGLVATCVGLFFLLKRRPGGRRSGLCIAAMAASVVLILLCGGLGTGIIVLKMFLTGLRASPGSNDVTDALGRLPYVRSLCVWVGVSTIGALVVTVPLTIASVLWHGKCRPRLKGGV